tara:strand:- start:616 stop:897 length:282 start_codon:yes stop_codon:yes gene_type:complete
MIGGKLPLRCYRTFAAAKETDLCTGRSREPDQLGIPYIVTDDKTAIYAAEAIYRQVLRWHAPFFICQVDLPVSTLHLPIPIHDEKTVESCIAL